MIKNGQYAWYKGNEFGLSEDVDDNRIIITEDKRIVDDTFEDTYHTGVFSKIIDLTELDKILRITTYGMINGDRVSIITEKDGGYLVGTSDCKMAEKLQLEPVDKYGYEGWLPEEAVQIFEEKQVIK